MLYKLDKLFILILNLNSQLFPIIFSGCIYMVGSDLHVYICLHINPIPLKLRAEKTWQMSEGGKKQKNKILVCGHAASAKNMVSHFTKQLEEMNHQAIPQVFKSILAHRHSVSCLKCAVHLNRLVKMYVMWKVCLVKCASLIIVFPSISVSPCSSPFPTPLSWRPYLFGAGCFAIKTPWWVLPLPSLAPSTACNCTLHQSSHPPLLLMCLLVYFLAHSAVRQSHSFFFSRFSIVFFSHHVYVC